MKAWFKISLRYFWAKKNSNAINWISRIAMFSFAICTCSLVIILSAMNGFEDLIFSMYNKFSPDLKVTLVKGKNFEPNSNIIKLNKIKNIDNIYEIIEDNAVIRNGDYQTVCTVKGVKNDFIMKNKISDHVIEGKPILSENNVNYTILGAGIAAKVNASINGPYNLLYFITPSRKSFNSSSPDAISQLEIEAGGIMMMHELINNKYVLAPFEFCEELFDKKGLVTSLEISLKPNASLSKTQSEIKEILGKDFEILNRMEQQSSIYKMFKSEKWASFAILTFILLIAAFNALGSLIMLVLEKKKDIETLSALGLSKIDIKKIFFTNAQMIVLIGCFIGLLIGMVLIYLQQNYGLLKMQGAIVENYPVKLIFSDIIIIAATCAIIGFFTGIYPAQKASNLSK